MRILIAVDLPVSTPVLMDRARTLATATGAEAFLVHVAPPEPDFVGYDAGPPSVRDAVAEELRDEHRRLEAVAEDLRAAGVGEVTPLLLRGSTAEKILEEASRCSADLIVLGTHARGPVLEAILGSVSHHVMRHARCPVVVVPAGPAVG